MRSALSLLSLLGAFLICACEQPAPARTAKAPKADAPPAKRVVPVQAQPVQAQPVQAQHDQAASPQPSSPGQATLPSEPEAPRLAAARSCAVRNRIVLDASVKLPSVVVRGGDPWLSWQRNESARSWLELARVEGTAVAPNLSIPLSAALSRPPVLRARADGSLDLALTDIHNTLSLLRVADGKASAPRLLAKGVDARFSPSLEAYGAGLLVAFTQTVETAMHTFVARVTDGKVDVHDVTPISHGAGSPSFVLGASAPTLVMLDARAGVSPLLEVGFAADGKPKPALVRTPVSQPYTPPLLSAVQLSNADIQVAYTAIGRAAATAVGIVALRRAEAPRALLPSLGYGALSFGTALGTRAAVFALESPMSAAASAARAIMVKVVDDAGEGPALTLSASQGSLSQPTLASGKAREFFLLYLDGSLWTLAVLDCDA